MVGVGIPRLSWKAAQAMERKPKCWIGLVLIALLCNLAWADIRTTKHSLARNPVKADGSDVCVYCHAPNMTGTPPEQAPLWQGSVGTTSTFTIYDDIGRLGLGKPSIGSQSIACLSCHDAIQARSVSKETMGQSSDHPFGVPYRGAIKGRPIPFKGMEKTNPDAPAVHAKHLVDTEGFRDVSRGIVEERTVWWVSASGVTGQRTRGDLPLYTRRDENSGEDLPFIECSSCHDPHSNNQSFLRTPNEGSRLCLTCHMK
ncbi:MAG: cytochrome c3 family protein [Rhodocyclaceae bacterium]|nr:cytochrome c3 family protein [Rhodocyclaceae bacterium]